MQHHVRQSDDQRALEQQRDDLRVLQWLREGVDRVLVCHQHRACASAELGRGYVGVFPDLPVAATFRLSDKGVPIVRAMGTPLVLDDAERIRRRRWYFVPRYRGNGGAATTVDDAAIGKRDVRLRVPAVGRAALAYN